MKRFRTATLVAVLLFFMGCESLFIPPNSGTDPQSLFEETWNFVDQEYSFFEFKGIDWDEVRGRYEPRIQAGMSQEALFEVLAEMLFELRDGHVNLRSSFDLSRNWTWYLNSPPNYDYNLLERNYFRDEQQFFGPFIIYDFGDVGYVNYASFTSTVTSSRMTQLIEKFGGHRGLIIDIRDNGGGSIGNALQMGQRFTTKRTLYARTRVRNGPEHTDFTPWEDRFITPRDGDTAFTKPVILLTNGSSYSAANRFTQLMRVLPNVTVMGDTTGGGGGGPADTDLANGWLLRVSGTQLESPDGFNVEDGIPPDTLVQLDSTDLANGIDTILEAALAKLRE